MLRRCPHSMQQVAVSVWTVLGVLAHLAFFLGGLVGIFLVPLLVAVQHPDALVVFPVRWLRAHLSEDAFLTVYVLIQGGIAGFLTYATIVYDHLHPRSERGVDAEGEPTRCQSRPL